MWTRASFDAARALLRAVSKCPGGNSTDEVGNGAWRSLDSSSGGTDERTSASRASLCKSVRLDRAETVWLPKNSRTLEPETTNRWKSIRVSSGRESPSSDMVASHQSSQETASPAPARAVSKKGTRA